MLKSIITPITGPATSPSDDAYWNSARLAAVVEAAYLLDAVRR
jgi:hypothetical protein